ncbi:MAG: helix-turn-helix transcriptional regulator [Myxococcales bacterium]|nr:helix-turn-helix transcriptional regulator [Myxococcales bacterium]
MPRHMPPPPIVGLRRARYWIEHYARMKGIRLVALARSAGISRTTWYRLMEPDPAAGGVTDAHIGTIESLARALEVDLSELFQPVPGEEADA